MKYLSVLILGYDVNLVEKFIFDHESRIKEIFGLDKSGKPIRKLLNRQDEEEIKVTVTSLTIDEYKTYRRYGEMNAVIVIYNAEVPKDGRNAASLVGSLSNVIKGLPRIPILVILGLLKNGKNAPDVHNICPKAKKYFLGPLGHPFMTMWSEIYDSFIESLR